MNLKKVFLFLLFVFPLVLLSLSIVPAELEIEKQAVVDVVIPEINKPAIYKLKIKNLGEDDSFQVYSLVGVEIKPNETFKIKQDETKTVEIELWPEKAVLDTPGTFNFVYKIKGEKAGIQNDVMLIKIFNLKDAIEINCYNINFDSGQAVIYARNRGSQSFPDIKAPLSSFPKRVTSYFNWSPGKEGEENFASFILYANTSFSQ